jgi:tetratricopeptide (TPR) repeat protein
MLESYVKAYELRERATESERHLVTANYHTQVLGDLPKAIESFRRQVDAAKLAGEAPLYASLMGSLVLVGDFASAEAVGWEARELRPTAAGHANLVKILYRRGKHRESDALLEEALQRFPKHWYLTLLKVRRPAAAGNYAASDSLAHEILRPLVDEPHYVYATNAAVRGRITDAISHLQAQREFLLANKAWAEAIEVAIAIGRLHNLAGNQTHAVREVDNFVAMVPFDSLDVLDRPYLALARLYAEAGRARRARTYLADYERAVPKIFRGADQSRWLRTRGAIRLAEGAARQALTDFEEASRHGHNNEGFLDDSYVLLNERPELARAYDRAGRVDAAIATYERYLAISSVTRTDIDAFELAPALYRLAELYEARNDGAAAARYYRRFAELWQDADPELQPRVQMAQRRADSLTTMTKQAS